MIVRLRAASEAVRNSLFFVPVLCVVLGVALAAGMLESELSGAVETLQLADPFPCLFRPAECEGYDVLHSSSLVRVL